MAHLASGTASQRAQLRDALVIAVDLGFAEQDESCGLAWRAGATTEQESCAFGACVRRIAKLVAVEERAALIVEAPLSGCFNPDGNPVARDYGETRANGRSLESGRGWYYGAGASVALGAVFLLRRLRDALATNGARLVLFEGFVSFKTKRSAHVDDARTLLDGFFSDDFGSYTIRAPSGGEMVTVLDVLGVDASGAPMVLMPPRPELVGRPRARR